MEDVYKRQAVHYQEDGEWKEIDNTLKPQESGDETVYQNNAGIWKVRLPEKLDASSAVEVEKGCLLYTSRCV